MNINCWNSFAIEGKDVIESNFFFKSRHIYSDFLITKFENSIKLSILKYYKMQTHTFRKKNVKSNF